MEILIAFKQSIEEQLELYDKQLDDWINTLSEDNEENEKMIENFEIASDNGKRILSKLKGRILGFQEHIKSELEERKRKEKLDIEIDEQELRLKQTEMELKLREKLEIERFWIEKLKIQTEKELKSVEMEKTIAKEVNTQRNDDRHATHKTTIKLPKLELTKFDGDLLKWPEFLDFFQTTIHNNHSLDDVDKLKYLRGQLRNEAREVIAGLEVTSVSYIVAVDLLKERYSNKQLNIDAHYARLRDIPVTTTYYEKLRSTFDQRERHQIPRSTWTKRGE